MPACNAKTRSGAPCRQSAMANGRCKMHGGLSLSGVDSPTFKHGRYSKVMPKRIADSLSASDADPLDLLDELDLQRGLLSNYLARFDTTTPQASDIAFMMTWLGDIGRTVERIVKMRNETALTKVEMAFIAARIADVVAAYIHDPDTQQRFIAELLGVTGRVPADAPALGQGAPAERA